MRLFGRAYNDLADFEAVREIPEGVVFEVDILKREFVNIVRHPAGKYHPVHSNLYIVMPTAQVEKHFDYLAAHFGYYAPTPSPMPEDDS